MTQQMFPSSTHKKAQGKLEGQVAIITGASGGIGQATALSFASKCSRVALHFSGLTEASPNRATKASNKLKELGFASKSLRANVSNYDVKSLVDRVVDEWGK